MRPMPQPLTVNTTDLALRDARMALAFGGSLDAKRPRAWVQFGYSETITFDLLKQAYDRGGAGHGAVHRLLEKCWGCKPRVKQPEADAETPWEKKLKTLFKRRKLWLKLLDADRRKLVGHYAGIIYRVADGLPLSQPLGRGELVDIVPVWESQLRVILWHTDPADPETFGKVKMWQYRARKPGTQDTQGQPDEWADVHPSRVQVLAEGAVGDFLDGTPLLRAGFNHLVDLEKISGGSAESYLKNSARTLVFKFAADANPQAITDNADGTPNPDKSVADAVSEKAAALNSNIDAAVAVQGGDATTLQTTISDPAPSFEVAANLFAASVRMPFTVIFGQQTGRLASDQDKADMNGRARARQENELEPMVTEFVERMQACGAIDAGEFDVEFEPLDTPGDDQKVKVLQGMTGAMQQAYAAGLTEPLFDANELRGVLDYEERTSDGMPPEGTPVDPAADPMADPAAGPPAPPGA